MAGIANMAGIAITDGTAITVGSAGIGATGDVALRDVWYRTKSGRLFSAAMSPYGTFRTLPIELTMSVH
jgi:hypothetical protein